MTRKRKNKSMNLRNYVASMTVYSKSLLGILAAIAVLVAATELKPLPPETAGAPTNFYECSRLHKVEEGFPRRCKANSGQVFIEYRGNQSMVPEVQVSLMPAPVILASPFVFSGTAPSNWFGPNQFPAELYADGRRIASASAKLQEVLPHGEDQSAFSISFTFTMPKSGATGAIVLHKAGSPGNATTSELVVPVSF